MDRMNVGELYSMLNEKNQICWKAYLELGIREKTSSLIKTDYFREAWKRHPCTQTTEYLLTVDQKWRRKLVKQEMIEKHPVEVISLLLKGLLDIKSNNYKQAYRCYRKALVKDPKRKCKIFKKLWHKIWTHRRDLMLSGSRPRRQITKLK